MNFVVRNDDTMPEYRERNRYPFKEMSVGSSFSFPKDLRNKVAVAAYNHGRAYGKKFAVRTIGEGLCKVYRIG